MKGNFLVFLILSLIATILIIFSSFVIITKKIIETDDGNITLSSSELNISRFAIMTLWLPILPLSFYGVYYLYYDCL
jgi:hypothetical protein